MKDEAGFPKKNRENKKSVRKTEKRRQIRKCWSRELSVRLYFRFYVLHQPLFVNPVPVTSSPLPVEETSRNESSTTRSKKKEKRKAEKKRDRKRHRETASVSSITPTRKKNIFAHTHAQSRYTAMGRLSSGSGKPGTMSCTISSGMFLCP